MSWLLAELLRRDLIDAVIHVAENSPNDGDHRLFRYGISRTIAQVKHGAKSRYYPIEFSEVLALAREQPGRYAFVGLPCYVKALRLLQRHDDVLRERVRVTFGLFCGHLKSAALVDSFALQAGLAPEKLTSVNFRKKQLDRRADIYSVEFRTTDGSVRQQDWANMVDGDWGMGFFQYSACNFCDDVMAETADVSFGDAWVPPYSADGRGTNVVVVRAAWIDEVLRDAIAENRVELTSIDGDFLAGTQAAGLRQRREGLAYRLHLNRGRFTPRKRVQADPTGGGWKRRRIYDLRMRISWWSHHLFAVARATRLFWVYRLWARAVGAVYRSLYWCDRDRLSQRLRQKLRRLVRSEALHP